MNANKSSARTIHGRAKPEFVLLKRPFSNFDFVEDKFHGLTTLRRIMSQVRQLNGKTMVIEELNASEDLHQENRDIKTRYPNAYPIKTTRLSFFTKKFHTIKGLANAKNGDFIGYAVIKKDYIPGTDPVLRIYESVIRSSRHENNYIRGEREWVCSVAGKTFKVRGYLYAQQNNITNVCAHVAVRSAAGCFRKKGDMTYREMNQLIGIDHISQKAGGSDGRGLNTLEIIKILENAGARCFVADYTKPMSNNLPFQKVLYGSIESGFPAIIIFETADEPGVCHAIPVFGHTFNEDAWVYRAEASYFKVGEQTRYIPSESWVSMYLAHDDNCGSNFCIPRQYLHARRYCDKMQKDENVCQMDSGCVLYVIGTRPKDVQMNALQAEVIGADYLFTILPQLPDLSEVWRERLVGFADRNQLVLRPILIKGNEYSKHLKKIRDWEGNKLGYKVHLGNESDSWLWIVELSIPELFSANKRKVAEIVLRAENKPTSFRDFNNFLFARLPGYFASYSSGGADNPMYEFFPNSIRSHTELYGCEESV